MSSFSKQSLTSSEKIDPLLLDAFKNKKEVRFFIKFEKKAKFPRLSAFTTKVDRGTYVFNQLRAVAEDEQQEMRRYLDQINIGFNAMHIINAIVVTTNFETAVELSEFAGVEKLIHDPWVWQNLPKGQQAIEARSLPDPEWGILNIGADQVWNAGFEGQGVTIGGADTGFDWTHPTIQKQYRGYSEDSVDHNYHWHDAIHSISPLHNDSIVEPGNNPCGLEVNYPCDDNRHGTHTMGTMVGQDSINIIGVAPKADWIACRNMERGWGAPSTYIECFEWFLAPTDLGGENPDPSMAPHVINNSWSCPELEGCNPDNWGLLQEAVRNLKMASVFVVVSAGNSGSGCNTVSTPSAMFEESFTIGAIRDNNEIANFSSRGGVSVDSSFRMKPDITAPGVNVRSSVLNGEFRNLSGTSMAGPHAAGAVALLISADPTLASDMDSIAQLITSTARPMTTEQECDGIPGSSIPNNTYGYGNLDVYQAYLKSTGVSVGTKEIINPEEIIVYPNPAQAEIFWEIEQSREIQSVSIVDLSGRRVYHKLQPNNRGNLKLNDFKNGMFFLQFVIDNSVVSKKVVVFN